VSAGTCGIGSDLTNVPMRASWIIGQSAPHLHDAFAR
jgi:hypothetical protein